MEYLSIADLIRDILETTGYQKELTDEDTVEAQARIENIDELVNKAVDYEKTTEEMCIRDSCQSDGDTGKGGRAGD